MSKPPVGKNVVCPACGGEAIAIVPRGSAVVERGEDAEGKVWVNCRTCGHRFLVYYRLDS